MASRTLGAVPPAAQVLLGIVSVQIGAALAKQLFATAGAAGTVTLRLFFAAVVLLLIWRPTLRLDRRTLPVVLAYGLVRRRMNCLLPGDPADRWHSGDHRFLLSSLVWRWHLPGPAACLMACGH